MTLIVVSNNLSDIRKAQDFAKSHKYQLKLYSVEKWRQKQKTPSPEGVPFDRKKSFFQSMDELKILAVRDALIVCRGNVSKAAQMLKVGRATLYRLVKMLQFDLSDVRGFEEQQASTASSTAPPLKSFKKTA